MTIEKSCCNNLPRDALNVWIDETKCSGCGTCKEVCPFGLPTKNLRGIFEVNRPKLCVQCSACQINCPSQAIIMQEQKGCGCLWDARGRVKNKGKDNLSCC